MALAANGFNTHAIAVELGITHEEAVCLIKRVCKRTGARGRTHAIALLISHQILPLGLIKISSTPRGKPKPRAHYGWCSEPGCLKELKLRQDGTVWRHERFARTDSEASAVCRGSHNPPRAVTEGPKGKEQR